MSRDYRLLVLGGSGELGHQVVRSAGKRDVHSTFLSRPRQVNGESWYQLDITDREAVHRLMSQIHPNAVVHTAVSAHDRAKFLSEDAFRMAIVDGGRCLAEAAAEVGARCIVMSTDLVFDGTQGNYREDDGPNPIMPYGQAKADMESVLLSMGTDLVVVRTSLVLTLDPIGKHAAWIVDALRHGVRRDLFTDELRCPIWSDQLADALLELTSLDYRGLLHVTGPEVCNRYMLGMALADYFDLDKSLIRPALSAESGLNRPLDCTLDCSRAFDLLETPIQGLSAMFGHRPQP